MSVWFFFITVASTTRLYGIYESKEQCERDHARMSTKSFVVSDIHSTETIGDYNG